MIISANFEFAGAKMVAITDARGLAYDFAKTRGVKWFTAKDLAAGAYIEPAMAQAAVSWLADMRLLDFNGQVRPRSYRINSNATQLVPELVREIENALEIILQRRKAEAKARASFFGANNSQYSYQPGPPNRRRYHRNGPPPSAGQSGPSSGNPSGGGANGGPANGPQTPSSGLFNMPPPDQASPAASLSTGDSAVTSSMPPSNGSGHSTGSQNPPAHSTSDLAAGMQSEQSNSPDHSVTDRATSTGARKVRAGLQQGMSKPDQLLNIVSEADGASIEELVQIFHVQAHTMRAMISGLRKTKNVCIEFANGRYRVVGNSPASSIH